MNQLRFLVLADSVAFQSFSLVFSVAGGVTLAEYVGAARRIGGVAEVAIAHVQATSNAIWATLQRSVVDCRAGTPPDCPYSPALFGSWQALVSPQARPSALDDGQCRILPQQPTSVAGFPKLGFQYLVNPSWYRSATSSAYRCREGNAIILYTAGYSQPGPAQASEISQAERALRAAAYMKLTEVLQ